MKTVFLFAGQGSQYFGMARHLFTANAVFRDALRDLDDVASGLIGHSIVEVLYGAAAHPFGEAFDRTLFSHPAVFMIEVALARAFASQGVEPDVVVGSSLGELAALVVSGVLTAEDALEACIAQAETLEARCAPGGMLAVLANPEIFDKREAVWRDTTLAGVNLSRHFVVSASMARCDELVEQLKAQNVSCQRLPVRIAFHSSAMDCARDAFLARVMQTPFATAKIPMLSAARAGWLSEPSYSFLWEVARAPIRFRDVLDIVSGMLPCCFVDLSPGATLATFVKHHFSSEVGLANLVVLTRFQTDVESFARVVAEHRRAREDS